MAWTDIFARNFNVGTRMKGERYASAGRVRVVKTDALSGEFLVRGTFQYYVRIDLIPEEGKVRAECTCPHFMKGLSCKHIWATFLQADRIGFFAPLKAFKVLQMEMGHELQPDVVGEEDWEDDYDEDEIAGTPAEETLVPETSSTDSNWKQKILKARSQRQPIDDAPLAMTSRIEYSKIAHFAIDLTESTRQQKICIRFLTQDILRNGSLGPIRTTEISHDMIPLFADAQDRAILWSILGKTALRSGHSSYSSHLSESPSMALHPDFSGELLAQMSQTERLHIIKLNNPLAFGRKDRVDVESCRFVTEPWRFKLILNKSHGSFFLNGQFTDGTTVRRVGEVIGQVGPFVFFDDFAAECSLKGLTSWLEVFRKTKDLEIPEDEVDSFLEFFFNDPAAPTIDLPLDLQFKDHHGLEPKVRLVFTSLKDPSHLQVRLEFDYQGLVATRDKEITELFDIPKRERIFRNFEIEKSLFEKFQLLEQLVPERYTAADMAGDGVVHEKNFVAVAEKALSMGWEVTAHQRTLRAGTGFKLDIASGVDWFDVGAEFNFDGVIVTLPQLIQHLASGQKLLQLDDGSQGMIPEEWLRKFGAMAEMAQKTETGLRLNKVQALFLSASLSDDDKLSADKKFRSLREIVDDLNNLKALTPTGPFEGKLRTYQKQGLSWLTLLSKHQIGGVLADDMGLGKTIQVLALLTDHQLTQKEKRPSLIVAPKSLIFNWMKESEKFTAHLKMLNFTGAKRHELLPELRKHDVVLTTYQSLRADIEKLKDVEFDFFILDEAHYIKNPSSQGAMACRMIQARRKLALTGTPVENALTDLFSILAVVTPGLISDEQNQRWAKETDPVRLRMLSTSLRPFILRRTKDQVLKDLPEKSEQVLYCELSVMEMKKYNELKAYYWSHLTDKMSEKGLSRSKIDVLEALLRLRQAACHQGLLNEKMKTHSSSKFDLLLDQVDSVIKDGHKALVFSQFTTLLRLLETHLKKRQISYEYLDGQTTNRQERVERFQNDNNVKLFLLSLKAGGVGLNLTAADYVFILDPWWNPAAESQAIDRTHRIGQNKKVFAYKIIAKDTVEEKILELQKTKRALANTVVSDEKSILKGLKIEDLQALFQ
jgi:superfamily II DNA or RNA helicase